MLATLRNARCRARECEFGKNFNRLFLFRATRWSMCNENLGDCNSGDLGEGDSILNARIFFMDFFFHPHHKHFCCMQKNSSPSPASPVILILM